MNTIIKKMLNKKTHMLAAITFAIFAVPNLQAATVTNTINPIVTLFGFCLMSSTDITFGNIAANGTNVTANGTLSILCTRTTTYVASISYPEYPVASHMVGQSKGASLFYNIVNPQNNNTFATSGQFSNPITDTASGFIQDYTLKATIPSVGYITPDNYKSTVNVLVTY